MMTIISDRCTSNHHNYNHSKQKSQQRLLCSSWILVYSFIVILIIRPLCLPNWWIFSGDVLQIKSEWRANECGARFDQQFVPLTSIFTNITGGGKYNNIDCPTAQHVAIIVPFRNRTEHLKTFLDQLHPFLLAQNSISYQIFVVEQLDDGPFNRGALLNIGYVKALEEDPSFGCFIFHDVDAIPLDLRQYYTCSSSYPRHLCSYIDKSRYVLMYREFFGVAFAATKQQYETINGFSNRYFGWGGEDDDFYERMKSKYRLFERYGPEVSRCRMLRHRHNAAEADDRFELLDNSLERMTKDGLNDVRKFFKDYSIQYRQLYTRIGVSLIQNK